MFPEFTCCFSNTYIYLKLPWELENGSMTTVIKSDWWMHCLCTVTVIYWWLPFYSSSPLMWLTNNLKVPCSILVTIQSLLLFRNEWTVVGVIPQPLYKSFAVFLLVFLRQCNLRCETDGLSFSFLPHKTKFRRWNQERTVFPNTNVLLQVISFFTSSAI